MRSGYLLDSQWPGAGGGAPSPKKPSPGGGGGGNDDIPIEMSDSSVAPVQPTPSPSAKGRPGQSKIRTFDQKLMKSKHEDTWNRTPNVTGTGAIHVKSFYCKLTPESLAYLDEQINEWLDAHPQYEVKLVTTSVGEWTGKSTEPAMICNVWV